ncbi:hypothetical protein M409DRAFT_28697 [Zasmidium cellare ATCC 36951]|uniref:Uncharacterized protein n=1 Tax=Zasmidium cellare ATCC 36951 TaxID=1080233 RepID=A0A6A6C3F4_ZASCE|nr:uncharacterized protein M409DRAFT_28697 [Zasmidium cellare ATCC 36951]KAF2160818.1 hypothetical protein M409DRAFT_28697 [Zasmidium cellare ATCC 36951]
MPTFPTDTSLASTAYTVLLISYYLLLLAASFALAMALPVATFHLGRLLAGLHFDLGHPGSLVVMFVAFLMYSVLCGLGPEGGEQLRWVLVNVPFGLGVLCAVCLGVWAVGLGVWRGVEGVLGRGREEGKVKGS